MPHAPRTQRSKDVRLRFPRIPGGKTLAEQGRQVWKKPDFSPKDANGKTQFIFSVPIQSDFRKLDPTTYKILFSAKKMSWMDALERAYREAQSRKETFIKYIDVGLYKLFSDALLILSRDVEGLTGDYTEGIKENVITFREAAPRTRGKKTDRKRATRLEKRFDFLLPRMRELRTFVDSRKQRGIASEESLRVKVKKAFKDDWISLVVTGVAFEKLPSSSSQGGTDVSSSLNGSWAPWQLTVGVIRCEEARLTGPVSALTIYRTVMQGRKLRSKIPTRKK